MTRKFDFKFFGKDISEVDRNNIEFVYVVFDPYRPVEHPEQGTYNPNYLGVFRWGAKGIGFGEVSMYRMSDTEPGCDKFYFDTEYESKNFLKQMFVYFVEQSITDVDNPNKEIPEYNCQYKPIEK